MLKLKLQYFGHLIRRANSLQKTLMLEKIEGKKRRWWQRMRWLVASLIQWTRIWANSGRWWRTGRPGMLQSMGLQSWTQLSDWTTTSASEPQHNKPQPEDPLNQEQSQVHYTCPGDSGTTTPTQLKATGTENSALWAKIRLNSRGPSWNQPHGTWQSLCFLFCFVLFPKFTAQHLQRGLPRGSLRDFPKHLPQSDPYNH